MKKTIYWMFALVAGLSLTGCNLNYVPSDELSADVLLNDEGGAKYILDGCYALMKDEVEFLGYASGNSYVRHYFQMSEFPADNVCLSGVTPDPLYNALAYKMTDDLKNLGTLWFLSYKAISMTNTVISVIDEKKSDEGDQLLGEAYFLRALLHTNLVTLWAKPYSHGRDNMGIIIRNSTNNEVTERATVGECYDQIVSDLEKATTLMKPGVTRGNAGYGNYEAAMALLTRIYLYEERYDDVVRVANALLGSSADSKLDHDFANYFANALTSKETLFCVAHTTKDNKGQASHGSMYNADGGGWGEVYPSDPLLNLYERYPDDVRYTGFIKPQVFDESKTMVTFPVFNQNDESGRANLIYELTADGEGYKFADGTVTKKIVNGEYTEWEANYKGEKIPARVTKMLKNRNNYYIYYVTKFGYQDGIPTLSSPVFLRYGEVVLNRAEAYARMGGNDDKALDDVNVIRARAGIPAEGQFSTTNMHGYANVIDVVMDERRMELAFEGHRMFDVYRNKQNMDRQYPGCQPWGVVKYDDPHIQYPIPFCEYSVSGIPQNSGY